MIFTALTEDSLWCFKKDGATVGISEENVVLLLAEVAKSAENYFLKSDVVSVVSTYVFCALVLFEVCTAK